MRNRLMELHDSAEFMYYPSPLMDKEEMQEIGVQLSDAGNILGTIEYLSREGETGVEDKFTPEERLKRIHETIFLDVSFSDIDNPEEPMDEDE